MRSPFARVVFIPAVLALATATLWAADGVQITVKVTSGTDTRTTQAQFDKTRMRTEVKSSTGGNEIVIFDGTKQVLDILNPDAKTYNEITKADIDRISAQMQSAMDQMNTMMANMPPAQRAQMEAMMQGRGMPGMSAAQPVKTEYRKNGTDKVGKWTCDKYDGYQNGQKTSEVCTIDPKALGLTPDDFAVTRQLADMFSKLVPQAAGQLFAIGKPEEQGFSGFPVRSTSTVAGVQTVSELTDIVHQALPDANFAVPAGYTKQDFPGMNAGMGRGRGR